MRIVVDENIPVVGELLGGLGELRLVPGRAIDGATVRDADVLIVRSVTRVDSALLDDSRLRFVGSATAGLDHVDLPALAERGIAFASAPGSNADSVVDYVLAVLALRYPAPGALAGRCIGIVGRGEVGSRLHGRLQALGARCVVSDPFLPPACAPASLEEALDCEAVTLHVPLESSGAHPTVHLLDAARLAAMRPDALLINTSRGPVVDNAALLARLEAEPEFAAVLDVWEFEPEVDLRLLARALVGTPHIAGYAVDGKLRGLAQVCDALWAFLGHAEPANVHPALSLASAGVLPNGIRSWQEAALHAYDPRADDARLRAALLAPPLSRAAAFDRLRRDYPVRREFSAWRIGGVDSALTRELQAAGFSE
jgi:erythronate-4-phosphate dehydrogenase